jgi:hypothetical protein
MLLVFVESVVLCNKVPGGMFAELGKGVWCKKVEKIFILRKPIELIF